MNISKIYEGWRNQLIPPKKLKQIINKVHKERISICRQCENDSIHHDSIRPDEHCIICGCTLSAKTKCLSCNCDIYKWFAILTPEQEEEIKQANEKANN